MPIIFYPLYWIYHDCWHYSESVLQEGGRIESRRYHHAGHCHLFMPDFNDNGDMGQQAYTGTQTYHFTLKDVWGPRSGDANQFGAYKLVGKPMWYFTVEEYWRRMYIQPWDKEDYTEQNPNHPERIGIRYDASLPCHTLGPFREGRGLYFFNTEMNRTLPMEYWLNPEKTRRQHYLRRQRFGWDASESTQQWSFEPGARRWDAPQPWLYGNNAYYDSDGIPIGFNKTGDVVRHKRDWEDPERYYRYAFVPRAASNGYSWPNPTPGAAEAALRGEYLSYFNFGLSPDDPYNAEYARRVAAAGPDADPAAIFADYCVEIFADLATAAAAGNREMVDFEEFCGIWEPLDDEQARAAGVYGDYPIPRPDAPAEPPWGDAGDFVDKEGNPLSPYDAYLQYFHSREEYTIPRGAWAAGDCAVKPGKHPREQSYSDEDGARRMYSDNLYYSPIIEYQTVVHLDNQRLPGYENDGGEEVWTDKRGAFGEGFEASIEIPYRKDGVVQSPFSDDSGAVHPIGEYFHDFKEANAMVYARESYGDAVAPETIARLEAAEAGRQERIAAGDPEPGDEAGPAEAPFLAKAKQYDYPAYKRFIATGPSYAEQATWFNANYAGRPIVMNPAEGAFDGEDMVWRPVVTGDRPYAEPCDCVAEGQVAGEPGNWTMEPKRVKFNDPGYKTDGVWVEQCLGAKVRARARLIFEDALGHRWEEWVDATEGIPLDSYNGLPEAKTTGQ